MTTKAEATKNVKDVRKVVDVLVDTLVKLGVEERIARVVLFINACYQAVHQNGFPIGLAALTEKRFSDMQDEHDLGHKFDAIVDAVQECDNIYSMTTLGLAFGIDIANIEGWSYDRREDEEGEDEGEGLGDLADLLRSLG